MIRGDIVVVAARGAYTGKPRPALVVQSDVFNDTHASVTICPITSEVIDADLFRIGVAMGTRTGLERPSQIMIDKIVTVPRAAITRTVGRSSDSELSAVSTALAHWLDL
ncbi:MAG: type II toxin-antitoxin system PemK/MazF family toxin [Vicinamibacterales bacterium]